MANRPKPAPTPPAAVPVLGVTGTFHGVFKSSHLLYQAFEVELKDGTVVGLKGLSRAPDLAASAVGVCSREIWRALRDQAVTDVTGVVP